MEHCLIGIITFNGAHRVANCLESIKKWQDAPENVQIDILIVDDGSHEPKCSEMIWLSKHYAIPVIFNVNNLGIAKSRNTICRYGNYDYIVLLDDDILVSANWLTCALFFLRENSNIGTVGWHYYHSTLADIPQILEAEIPLEIRSEHPIGTIAQPQRVLAVSGSCCAFNKARWHEVGSFNENYISFYEDYEFGTSLTQKGLISYYLPYPLLYHCCNSDYLWGQTFTENSELLKPQIRVNQSRAIFKKKFGKDVPALEKELLQNIEPQSVKWLDIEDIGHETDKYEKLIIRDGVSQ